MTADSEPRKRTSVVVHAAAPRVYRVEVFGVIDQTFELSAVQAVATRCAVILDFREVERITSFGVREFQRAVRGLGADYVCFTNCHPMLVWQFNMIRGFASDGELVSLYLPYRCEDCGACQELLVDLRTSYDMILSRAIPTLECEACHERAEFDDVFETYFEYVLGAGRPSPPAHVSATLDGHDSSLPMRIEKDVTDRATVLWVQGSLNNATHVRRMMDGLEGETVISLGDVTSSTEPALRALASLLETTSASVCLARVPPHMWSILSPKVRTVSISLPFECPRCGRRNCLVNRVALRQLAAGTIVTCTDCKANLSPAVGDLIAVASTLPLSEPPVEIKEYLREHTRSPTASRAPAPTRIGGCYEIESQLGQGGMGEVYLATRVGLGGFAKQVVLKLIRAVHGTHSNYVRMFLKEARVAAGLTHANIVQIFDVGESDDVYYIAMEYVRGCDLQQVITGARNHGRQLPLNVCCTIASDVLSALDYAHNYAPDGKLGGIIHRDVSPDNILVSETGVVKLADFGIAKTADSTTFTEIGVTKGKWAYLPPEVLRSEDSNIHDGRGDVFSVGVVLFEMLIARRLFSAARPELLRRESRDEAIPPLDVVRPDAPPELATVMRRALATDPNDRYPTASEFRAALDHVLISGFGRRARADEIARLIELRPAVVPKQEVQTVALHNDTNMELLEDPVTEVRR